MKRVYDHDGRKDFRECYQDHPCLGPASGLSAVRYGATRTEKHSAKIGTRKVASCSPS